MKILYKYFTLILGVVLMCAAHAEVASPMWDPFEDKGFEVYYEGNDFTLNIRQIPLSQLIIKLHELSHENIVLAVNEDPLIDLSVSQMDFKKTLFTIAKVSDLSLNIEDGVWMFSDAMQENINPHEAKTFILKYIKADDIKKILTINSSVLSKNGTIISDARTNILLIEDEPSVLDKVSILIKKLDVPLKQVFIQARILNASKGFSKALGVSFSAQYPEGDFLYGNLGENVANTLEWRIAKLPSNISLEMHLAAAEKNNQTEVIAMPKILTGHQQKAVIKQGKELAYEETSASGATSVRFKEAVLELAVTPHITPDLEIILDLQVKHDVIGQLAENGQPTIDTQSIQTQVRLNNGETIVLGGIYSSTGLEKQHAVPWLSKVPIIGYLFREEFKQDDKNELLIFVTPRILEEDIS